MNVPASTPSADTPAAGGKADSLSLPLPEQKKIRRQRLLSLLVAPLWVPLLALLMRFFFGWRFENARAVRKQYLELRRTENRPVMICANHLTMLDSAILAGALGTPWSYLKDFAAMPWNVPESQNFAGTRLARTLAYLFKCVPIERGGGKKVIRSLQRVSWLLQQNETVLIFPEGGRSRSGRVTVENPAHGVGRLLAANENCLVICAYLRGAGQENWSNLPKRGERFQFALRTLSPSSEERGLRKSRDLTQQILAELSDMEAEYFAAKKSTKRPS